MERVELVVICKDCGWQEVISSLEYRDLVCRRCGNYRVEIIKRRRQLESEGLKFFDLGEKEGLELISVVERLSSLDSSEYRLRVSGKSLFLDCSERVSLGSNLRGGRRARFNEGLILADAREKRLESLLRLSERLRLSEESFRGGRRDIGQIERVYISECSGSVKSGELEILVYDDFESLENWEVLSGYWGIVEESRGKYLESESGLIRLARSLSWSNYLIKVEVWFDDFSLILFRLRENGDRFQVKITETKLYLEKVEGGVTVRVLEVSLVTQKKRWFEFKVEVSGSRVKVMRGSLLIFDLPVAMWGAGGIGLGGSKVAFDSFRVLR